MLSDNFKNYPSFTIPSKNHYLSLTGEPPESNSYYTFLSYLRTLLLSYDGKIVNVLYTACIVGHKVLIIYLCIRRLMRYSKSSEEDFVLCS